MKNNLLWFLSILFLLPTLATGAELHTLQIDFSYSAPNDPPRQLLGFRLYMDGQQVCETDDPTTSSVSCDILTEDGTFDFSLTAYFSDSTESPHSPSFPLTIDSSTYPGTSQPLTAVLSSSTAAGYAPLTVSFDGTASKTVNSSITSYRWTFGDGSKTGGKKVSHVYTTAGTYYAKLTITDSEGLTDTVSTPIVVSGTSSSVNETPIAVISTSQPQGESSLVFSFDGSQSSDPDGSIAGYRWDFGDGTTGHGKKTTHTYTSAGNYIVTLKVKDDQGATASSTNLISCSTSLPDSNFKIEVGEVSINDQWIKVPFDKTFNQPVVIAGPPTFNGRSPAVIRIRNVDQDGFEIRVQEWDYLNGTHKPETVSYVVLEQGVYTLNNGRKVEAGYFTSSTSFNQVALQQLYDFPPVVLTQAATENEVDAVTDRICNINQYSFEHKLQEMHKSENGHLPETIGYIAWEPGKGRVSGLRYEIGLTAQEVNHKWFDLTFEKEFTDLPFFVAEMQTCAGGSPASLRSQDMSPTSIQIKIQEERSENNKIRHKKEAVGYFTIGQ